ncbi:translation elongation factor 4 [Spirochaeta africana]|uniref:Elongation factor 4 n=1 Tax=Spirochaeta africana (strain ATCC 700263 / DSM 8902 / Z-7692) TaxID=889378 RepID=H9UK76_SPIAZ|nr:translation elongation factor 4 [Spirochaeta africana]AFG37919.1 GTP-binding protein LepA [Spirochaeta africana DSM 8902]
MIPQKLIRNFCIIAHIDHGKSTLADRFIQRARVVEDRLFQDQILDSMDIERERGITIKSQAVTVPFESKDGQLYHLNLVDTPGHVDFSYEVSRAISSCEGALLLIDASQGVEAQTLANLYMAIEHDLEIIPVINKIDLPSADVEGVLEQIEHDLGLPAEDAVKISAKNAIGIDELLETVVERIPAPTGDYDAPLKALIFDSHYNTFRGGIMHCRLFDGVIRPGDDIHMLATDRVFNVEEVGRFRIGFEACEELQAGQVGYIVAGIRTITDIRVGETVTHRDRPCAEALPGFREVKSVVFSSIFPVDANDYNELSAAMEKLQLNDASLFFEKDSSAALGFGFRCGFLGLLHLEVIQERLEREFGLSIVFTAPSVSYRIDLSNGESITVTNPQDFPAQTEIERTYEPFIKATLITPSEYVGNLISLCTEKRGNQLDMIYLDSKRVELVYEMPLSEVLYDFYDRLKSLSRGYASFDYEVIDVRETDLVRLDILLNGQPVDALSMLVYRPNAAFRARAVCKKLREEIPRHQFKIPIQGAVGSTIVARETISALRKDVTAKCYGGDISRKRKLLEKQKEGKKRMKMVGNVELPQKAFLSVLKSGGDD